MRQNKKASIQDLFVLIVIIFIFGLTAFVGIKIFDAFKSEPMLQQDAGNYTNQSFYKVGKAINVSDNLVLFFFVLVSIIILVLAATIKVHPAFLVVVIILFLMAVFFSIVVSNTYHTFGLQSAFTGNSITMTKTNFLMDKLPFFVGGVGFLIMVVMFSKSVWGG